MREPAAANIGILLVSATRERKQEGPCVLPKLTVRSGDTFVNAEELLNSRVLIKAERRTMAAFLFCFSRAICFVPALESL